MENDVQLGEYFAIIRRRFLYFLIPFILVGGLGAGLVVILPPIYQSTGVILVESQQIPTELIRSTITSYADERIQLIKQRVMTRENLMALNEKFNIFVNAEEKLTATQIVDRMRNNISIVVSNSVNKKKSNIAFSVSFEHKQPGVALKVTNELVTLFLSENVTTRTERASETTSFLTDQAGQLKRELEQIEDRIAKFKQENADALPEHLNLRLNMLQRAQDDLKKIGLELKDLDEEKRFLEIERTSLQSLSSGGGTVVNGKSERETLETLLKEKLMTFGSAHPEVKAIKNRLEALEPETSSSSNTSSNSVVPQRNAGLAKINLSISSIEAKKDLLEEQAEKLTKKIQDLEAQIIKIPQVERGLISLSRDRENSLKKYEELRAKELEAKFSENLEAEQKAERFSLLEPPVIADTPIKPNRKKMGVLAFAVAFAVGAGCFLLVEMMDQSVRGLAKMERIIQHETVVAIPYLITEREQKKRRKLLIFGALAILLSIIIGVVCVHFFYQPLDLLFYKVLNRLQ